MESQECVEFPIMPCISGPRFTAVEESAEYTGLVHTQFGLRSETWIVPDPPLLCLSNTPN